MSFQKELLERLKSWTVFAFLLTVPIFFISGAPDLRVVQEKYFHIAAMLFGSLFFGNIWITLFVWLNMAFFTFNGAQIGNAQTLSIFLSGILFACSRNYFSKNPLNKSVQAIYIVATISMIFMVLQTFGIDPLHFPTDQSGNVVMNESLKLKSGMFLLPPFNAIFLTVVASLFLFLVPRFGWLGFLLVIPVIDSRCSAAFLAWAFLIPFWFYWKFRKLFIPLLLVGLLGFGFYTYKDFSGDKLTYNSRFESWHMMFQQASNNWIGFGPDSLRNYTKTKDFIFKSDGDFKPILQRKVDENTTILRYHSAEPGKWKERFEGKMPAQISGWDVAHNDYLQHFFEYGVFGLILLFFFMREIFLRFRKCYKTEEQLALFSCLMVFFLTATTQFPFHLARLSGIFGILLGAYCSKTDLTYLKGDKNEEI